MVWSHRDVENRVSDFWWLTWLKERNIIHLSLNYCLPSQSNTTDVVPLFQSYAAIHHKSEVDISEWVCPTSECVPVDLLYKTWTPTSKWCLWVNQLQQLIEQIGTVKKVPLVPHARLWTTWHGTPPVQNICTETPGTTVQFQCWCPCINTLFVSLLLQEFQWIETLSELAENLYYCVFWSIP